jgi:hypothetical protein
LCRLAALERLAKARYSDSIVPLAGEPCTSWLWSVFRRLKVNSMDMPALLNSKRLLRLADKEYE